MSRRERVVVDSPAKVNLYLGVGRLRPDGYHDVDTVLQCVEFVDVLTLESAPRLSCVCEPSHGILEARNLAYRAAVEFARALGREPAVKISIDKHIPVGAGLGGASSNAAATLYGLALLWGVSPGHALLQSVAERLGMDVPFFLEGGTAWFSGRGETLVRSIPTPDLDIVLIKPDRAVSTARAYEVFDRIGATPSSAGGIDRLVVACESGDAVGVAEALNNDLTAAALALSPETGIALGMCDAQPGVLGRAVSGSGSAVFAICSCSAAASRLVATARLSGYWARAARSRPVGAGPLRRGDAR